MDNVVATLGTALTERHVRMLGRYAKRWCWSSTPTRPGRRRPSAGWSCSWPSRLNVRVASRRRTGKDPCDYVLASGGGGIPNAGGRGPRRPAVRLAPPAGRVQAAGGNLADRRKAAEEFLRLVVNSSAYGAIDPVRRGLLANRLAGLLRIRPEELQVHMRRLARRVPTASLAAPANRAEAAAPAGDSGGAGGAMGAGGTSATAARTILEVLIAEPELFEFAARHVGLEDFTDPLLGPVAKEVWRLGQEGALSLESLLNVEAGADWGRLVTDLEQVGRQRGNHEATLAGALDLVELGGHRREMARLRQAAGGDDEALRQLADKLRRPDLRRRPMVP